MKNHCSISEFVLLALSEDQELQLLHFFVFLALYMTAVTGNLLIIALTAFDHRLHKPMYFFLMNLATMDLGSISVIVLKALANTLTNSRTISYSGCVAQVFFYFFFQASDLALLTVMAHDRYVAICNPLQYESIMHKEACIKMAANVWFSGILYATLHTGGTFANSFCSNIVDQFFCDIPALLKLACSDLYFLEIGLILFCICLGIGCFVFIILSYVHIFATVLRIPSVQGQKKALSTCLPHLSVVSLFYFTAIFSYGRSLTSTTSRLDIVLAVGYTILPPMFNPFIYSMRNKDIKLALLKFLNYTHCSNGLCLKSRPQGIAN